MGKIKLSLNFEANSDSPKKSPNNEKASNSFVKVTLVLLATLVIIFIILVFANDPKSISTIIHSLRSYFGIISSNTNTFLLNLPH